MRKTIGYSILIIPLMALATMSFVLAQQPVYDLSVSSGDIFFRPPRLIEGQAVRLYANVRNTGQKDLRGFVTFYQGFLIIDEAQPISVRAGGLSDEVFVDFVVPKNPFNIRAEIKGQNPRDDEPGNDIALSSMATPEQDTDLDSVPNSEDNCPALANQDQKNTDSDAQGDACDPDDDNDGIPDAQEIQQGSNPLVAEAPKSSLPVNQLNQFGSNQSMPKTGVSLKPASSSSNTQEKNKIATVNKTATKTVLMPKKISSRKVRMSSLIDKDSRVAQGLPLTFSALASEEGKRK